MSLKRCVAAAGLAHALQPGLQALGANSRRIAIEPPARATESIDLDRALTMANVPGPKWDYGIGVVRRHVAEMVWVEVHPATSSEVDAVLKKLDALKRWLAAHAPSCARTRSSFHWVATKGVHIDEYHRRKLNANGLQRPQTRLRV